MPARETYPPQAMRETEARIGTVVAVAFFLAGGAMLYGSFYLYREDSNLTRIGRSAEGTVVAKESRPFGGPAEAERQSVYTVRFTETSGTIREVETRFDSLWTDYQIGDRIPVLYDPSDPTRAVVDDWRERRFGSTFLFGMGALFAVASLWLVAIVRRRQRAPE